MTSRIQTVTKQYGVQMMVSEQIYESFSRPIKQFLRFIDKVTLKGSIIPIKLYCFDINWKMMSNDREIFNHDELRNYEEIKRIQDLRKKKQNLKLSEDASQKIDDIIRKIERLNEIRGVKSDVLNKNPRIISKFIQNKTIQRATIIFKGKFKKLWENAIYLYLEGRVFN